MQHLCPLFTRQRRVLLPELPDREVSFLDDTLDTLIDLSLIHI